MPSQDVSQLSLGSSKLIPGHSGFFAAKFVPAGECFATINIKNGNLSLDSTVLGETGTEIIKLKKVPISVSLFLLRFDFTQIVEKLFPESEVSEVLAHILFLLASINIKDSPYHLPARSVQTCFLPLRSVCWNENIVSLCEDTLLGRALTRERLRFRRIVEAYNRLCESKRK